MHTAGRKSNGGKLPNERHHFAADRRGIQEGLRPMSHADLLSLSDAELEAVMQHAAPLPPSSRAAFLIDVAAELKRHAETGPGLVSRVCRDLQRRHFHPPILDHQQLN
jgi:hypothetical protein